MPVLYLHWFTGADAKQLQLLTERSHFPGAWPAQSVAVPRLQLQQSPTLLWTVWAAWLWVWCLLLHLEIAWKHLVWTYSLLIKCSLSPSSVLVFSFALWVLCLLLCSLLQENLLPYILALLLPSLYVCALLLSLLLKLHKYPWCAGLQLIEGNLNKCLE